MAAKIVWYSFSWSPKLMVTPLRETCLVAADALPALRPMSEAEGKHERRQSAQRRGGSEGRGCQQMHGSSFFVGPYAAGPKGGRSARRRSTAI